MGSVGAGNENRNGLLFRTFLRDAGMSALNTWCAAGSTWTSTHGTWHRIEYVCAHLGAAYDFYDVQARPDIDISPMDRVDHVAVVARTTLRTPACNHGASVMSKARKPGRVDVKATRVPWQAERFQEQMWQFRSPVGADIPFQAFNDFTRRASSDAFGTMRGGNPGSLRPLGRGCAKCNGAARDAELRVLFVTWAAQRSASFDPGRGLSTLRWPIEAYRGICIGRAAAAHKSAALSFQNLVAFRRSLRPLLRDDRDNHLLKVADLAQQAADDSDFKKSYSVVRALANRTWVVISTIKLEDGTVPRTADEQKLRWTRHHTEVFSATNFTSYDGVKTCPVDSPCTDHDFHPTCEDLSAGIQKLANGKTVGPEAIPAEVL